MIVISALKNDQNVLSSSMVSESVTIGGTRKIVDREA